MFLIPSKIQSFKTSFGQEYMRHLVFSNPLVNLSIYIANIFFSLHHAKVEISVATLQPTLMRHTTYAHAHQVISVYYKTENWNTPTNFFIKGKHTKEHARTPKPQINTEKNPNMLKLNVYICTVINGVGMIQISFVFSKKIFLFFFLKISCFKLKEL